MTPRDLFNIDLEIDIYAEIQNEDRLLKHCNNDYIDDGIFPWLREGVYGVTLDAPTPKSSTHIIEGTSEGIEPMSGVRIEPTSSSNPVSQSSSQDNLPYTFPSS
ncbi:hypothetical protein ACH5RR_041207 [Cinchona calisaya]|uniref:Uncharacterized protein n=1 Tax=Cinchona calisaya TaxID=153742 RepID=A0ABD2XYB3_9GENT